MAHQSFSGPPEAFSLSFSPLCPWIRGLFPAIEFTVAPSSSLPNSSDPRATLARACLNSSDFTATERRGAAHSRLFPRSNLLRPIQIERLGPRVPLHARLFPRSDLLRLIQIERLGPRVPLRARLFPWYGPLRLIQIERPISRITLHARTPDAVARLSAPKPSGAGPTRSARSPALSLTLPGPPISARPPAPVRPRSQI
jgi:hypothetical protein